MKRLIGFIVLAMIAGVIISCASQPASNQSDVSYKDVKSGAN